MHKDNCNQEGENDPRKVLTPEELQLQLVEKLTQKKASISLVVSQLMENPEGNVN